jgi:hypothetical protein
MQTHKKKHPSPITTDISFQVLFYVFRGEKRRRNKAIFEWIQELFPSLDFVWQTPHR